MQCVSVCPPVNGVHPLLHVTPDLKAVVFFFFVVQVHVLSPDFIILESERQCLHITFPNKPSAQQCSTFTINFCELSFPLPHVSHEVLRKQLGIGLVSLTLCSFTSLVFWFPWILQKDWWFCNLPFATFPVFSFLGCMHSIQEEENKTSTRTERHGKVGANV